MKSLNSIQKRESQKIQINNNSKEIRQPQRVCSKQIYKNEWKSKTIIETTTKASSKIRLYEQFVIQTQAQQAKIKAQYQLQSGLKSEYIIKNFQMKVELKRTIIYQQYYLYTLNDMPIANLSFEKRLKIFYSLAKGVRDMQSQLVCHCSLNPSHVCITKEEYDPIAKINYFGVALKLDSMKSKIAIASAGINNLNKEIDKFSSPQLRKRKEFGLPSDVWSLGALLNYLLYETMDNIWQESQEIKMEVPVGTSAWLFELLKSMLHYNPQKRYSIVTILDILKVSMKCVEVMAKYTPLGSKLLKLNRQQTKMKIDNLSESQQ